VCAFSCGCRACLCCFSLPSSTSKSTNLFHVMLACVLTLWRVVGYVLCCSMYIIADNISLPEWLVCNVVCLICVFMRYREFRVSVNIFWFIGVFIYTEYYGFIYCHELCSKYILESWESF